MDKTQMLTPEEKTIVRSAKVNYFFWIFAISIVVYSVLTDLFKITGLIVFCVYFICAMIYLYRIPADKILKRFKHNARVAGYALREMMHKDD